MRVTQNMMVENFLTNAEMQYKRLGELNTQIASGNRINKPSDDPSGLARIRRYQAAISRIDSYSSNVNTASAWSQTTQDSISEASDLVQQALEKAMTALSDTTTEDARNGISEAVSGYIDELISLANRSQNNRYLFSGTQTSMRPFVRLDRGVTTVGSLPPGVNEITIGSPFSDLPELERSVYTVEVTSDGVNATISLKEADGSSVQIDDNSGDDTRLFSGANRLGNSVTVALGQTVDTGRGLRIMTSAAMASGTQSFRVMYTPQGSFEYVGNSGAVKSKIGDDLVVDVNVAGNTFLQADTVIGTASIDAVSGTPVSSGGGDVKFLISDGTTTRTIRLEEGAPYTQSDVLALLDQAGLFIGEGDQCKDEVFIQASFDSQGHLRLRPASEGVSAKIVLSDLSTGANTLKSFFGVSSGQTAGAAVLDTLNRLARNIAAGVVQSKIHGPSDWKGQSSASVGRDGYYTGVADKTWVFTVGSKGGLLGQTDGVTVTVTDKATGRVVKSFDVGEAYTSGEPILIADGVSVSFSGNSAQLEAGDSFTLDLRHDRSESVALNGSANDLIKNEAQAGSTLEYMTMVQKNMLDYQTLMKQQLEEQQGVDLTAATASLQQEELAYETSLAVGARILNQVTLLNYL
ncbi:MAG: flagellar hook-associated protein FlgL [Candidatus Coatesbacteria bacterium]|nr:flagellar hook-associated protein FlgL [Candidatus Coatesbacteria bacterium]